VEKIKRKGMQAKRTIVNGVVFDSELESQYYKYLIQNKEELNIKEIELQKTFELIPSFKVVCFKCNGSKKVLSPKGTGRKINCSRCKGEGQVKRHSMSYTPDFIITFNDGSKWYVDVKNDRYIPKEFPYYKKMFEYTTFIYLVIATYDKKKKEWIYK
jgi:Protein of unknown function (DUF1064)